MSHPRRSNRQLLIDTGELLATLELTLAELRVFTDELRDHIDEDDEGD